jgi:hypothetical protein
MNIEKLRIDKYPVIDAENLVLKTEYEIDKDEEITISINNSIVLDIESVSSIEGNIIELIPCIELLQNDNIIIVYSEI